VGFVAHIVAHSDSGPRGDPSYTAEQRNEYSNLILLCGSHHVLVDRDPETFDADSLRAMKRAHEDRVRRALSVGEPWNLNVSHIDYLNIPRLSALAVLEGADAPTVQVSEGGLFAMSIEFGRVLLQFQSILKRLSVRAIEVNSLQALEDVDVGTTLAFNRRFRTKNCPEPETVRQGSYALTGRIERDPHIYLTEKSSRLVLPYDPFWLTTMTSFVHFRAAGGASNIAGLCSLRSVNPKTKQFVATPLLMGLPASQWDQMFD
jgi:hypothetical protein